MTLRVYFVHSIYEDPMEFVQPVVANTARQARQIAWQYCALIRDGADRYVDVTAYRARDFRCSEVAARYSEPTMIERQKDLRDCGLQFDGSESCGNCNLSDPTHGIEPEWAVCGECYRCGECGHQTYCQLEETP